MPISSQLDAGSPHLTAATAPRPHDPATEAPYPGPSEADVRQLGANISSLMRSFHRAKAQFVAATEHDVAWSAHVMLARLAAEGPLRAGELADLIQSDPSTVSRQVASIVKAGLVQRQADPEDGRASLLVLTEKGHAVYRQQLAVRTRHMARMLENWSEHDCRQLAALLDRLTTDFDNYRPQMFDAATHALAVGGES
jgi:DNA-binding MarR family transcriptional regulator